MKQRTETYRNMSVPAKSLVSWSIAAGEPYVGFRVERDCGDSWIAAHAGQLAARPVPRRFLVASLDGKLDNGRLQKLNAEITVCDDPVLTAAIVGRISGTIFIPSRPISLAGKRDDVTYCFPAREFEGIWQANRR